MTRRTLDAPQTNAVVRGVVGCCLVCWPDRLGNAIDPSSTSTVTIGLMRTLGVRHLVESAVLWRWPSTRLLTGLTAVDVIHASSMGAIAAGSSTYRRLGTVGLLLASSLAGLTLAARARSEHQQ